MRIPFISRSGGKIVVIADIGGGGSAVGLIKTKSAGPAELAAYARVHANLEERDRARALSQLSSSLKDAAQAAHTAAAQQKLFGPRELYAVVHAPWIASKTLSAQRAFDKETRITDALIGELAKEALASDPSVVRDNLAEASVSHVELNGYTVHEPSRHSAHHVKVIVLASEIEKECRESLQAALQASFPGLTVKWRSYIRALSSLLHERGSDGRNAVVVDVADDATAIAVLRKQELASFANVSVGLHAILTQLSSGSSREETLALLSMLERGTCSSAECDRVSASLSQAETELTKHLGEGLASLAALRRLPNDLFIVAHPDIAPWLARFFARIDFAQFTMTAKPFSVYALTPADLTRLVTAASGLRADTSIFVAAALVHNEMHQ
jgi:hypothetical protein